MTTTFFLVRHAAHDDLGGYLAGRLPGIRLGERGRKQALRVAERLRREQLSAVHAGPRERTRETAAAIADACGMEGVLVDPELDEVDFGASWQGKDFAALEQDPSWRRWNNVRSLARTPGGERMLDVQCRALGLIERLGAQHAEAAVALVSHAEVIRAVVSHTLGMSIEAWNRFEVSPASISSIAVGEWGAKVLSLNEVIN